ncbi:Nicastrin family protein [Nitzschia inconspicua]|uniref:Nicastrin n=1 Tax=Nitzschia inconspicua TaxID=303405 RepID=A0A9K3L1N5_9STRA|nr:Nicastrin family protein [Nitzschia inconspicua]
MNFRGLLWSLFVTSHIIDATDEHTSLDQPFQSSFHHLQHSPCVTLYHRNGRAGCGTIDRETQAGPIYYYDGSGVPNGRDFVAVIEEYQLTSTVINSLLSSNVNGNLKGIMVLNGTDADSSNDYASQGPIYPLGYSTPSQGISYGNNAFPWNAKGDGLIQYDLYGVPLVYINEYETSYYIRNAAKNRNKASEIYTQFNYYMGPDGINSKDCLQWHDANSGKWNPRCLPLGGVSVWGFAGSPPKKSNHNYPENYDENAANGGGRDLANNGYYSASSSSSTGLSNVYKPAIVVGTSTDSTSMFHDLVPGANEGASNTLTLLMAAYLIGKSVDDATLDALPNRIVFGFFDGEAYGYLGSRRFVKDVLNFGCGEGLRVRSVAKDDTSDMACLYPMQPSMRFKDLNEIAAFLTVDQVGIPVGDGNLFVHNSGEGGMGTFLANVMKYSGTSYFKATASAAGNNANEYPYPPTPLSSVLSVTGGNVGGAVLSGYDYAFNKRPPYQSHLNWIQNQDMNLKSIASAATILARTALAGAYDNGSYDYETASSYAKNLILELSIDNEVLLELANCLFVDGKCNMLNKFASMDAANERAKTNFDIGVGSSLGKPPNYYVGVYNTANGQPFVRVGGEVYGAYQGNDYGNNKNDAIGMQPKMLQQAIRNMLDTFLGKGSMVNAEGSEVSARACSTASDCSNVQYCSTDADSATCSANKVCVCKRGFYHVALDEAINAAPNNSTGYFEMSSSDAGASPLWTEPYWNNVGVKMYRYSSSNPGVFVLLGGAIFLGACFFVVVLLKVAMKKQKLY